MSKFLIRGGHCPECTGANGFINEQKEMWTLADHVARILADYGHQVKLSKPHNSNMYKEMDIAHKEAHDFGADYFIAIHANAANGQGKGTECWVYDEASRKGAIGDMGYRVCYQFEQLGFANRGVKTNNKFYDLKQTRMPAMIIETFFVDNQGDVDIFNRNSWDRLARAICNGLDCNIPLEAPKPEIPVTDAEGFYRVIAGSYKNKANAEKQMEELKKQGVNAFIAYYEK